MPEMIPTYRYGQKRCRPYSLEAVLRFEDLRICHVQRNRKGNVVMAVFCGDSLKAILRPKAGAQFVHRELVGDTKVWEHNRLPRAAMRTQLGGCASWETVEDHIRDSYRGVELSVLSNDQRDQMRVKATREGLVGGQTASGYIIDVDFPFVALPARVALFRLIRITNPANGKSAIAQVLDIGPWNTRDKAYVLDGERPQAETGVDLFGRETNHAGIDLGERVYSLLGMTGNGEVDWEFVSGPVTISV